jgi:hypothetical protein
MLRQLRTILKRSVARAQARDKVKRNVVLLCDVVPRGRSGRPSKAFTLEQLRLSLRLRALTWDHVHLEGKRTASPPVPPSIMVWHSVRAGGEHQDPLFTPHTGAASSVR